MVEALPMRATIAMGIAMALLEQAWSEWAGVAAAAQTPAPTAPEPDPPGTAR